MNARFHSHTRLFLTALTVFTTSSFCLPSFADQPDFPAASSQHCTIRGIVRRVDPSSDRLVLVGDDDQVYTVDAYGARIILADITRRAETGDLERGMHVRASGTLVNGNLVEAMTVREVSGYSPQVPVRPAPVADVPDPSTTLEGVVRMVDPDHSRITIADTDGARDLVDTYDATIVLPGRASGQTADLARGMRVQVAGTRLADDKLVADRVRVLPDAVPDLPPAPVPVAAVPLPTPVLPTLPAPRYGSSLIPPSPDPQYVLAHLDEYTGILIDARHLSAISRSPAPAVFGPNPGGSLLYPDRSHVPTPDEVQDESIVRYYHTEAEAHAGVAGDNPLVLPAQAVLTPAQDALQLSADDMVLFNALEKKLHYSRTWKVGFLIPGDK